MYYRSYYFKARKVDGASVRVGASIKNITVIYKGKLEGYGYSRITLDYPYTA